jgi:diguanylate cyclase (GGDEF)-like protein
MAGAVLNPRRRNAQDLHLLEPVLQALLPPLAAQGAAVIALDDPGGAPIILYATGERPLGLLGATDLLLAGLREPCHGLCSDQHPVLAGPWEMPTSQSAVLVFWRETGGRSWKKQDHTVVLTVAAALTAFTRHILSSQKDTTWHGIIDKLTGLPRARKFVSDLPRHFARLDRDDLPGTLMLVSIDGFSQFGARFGRKDADEVLRQAAWLLGRMTRPTDVVARIDNDEFAIWLNGVDHLSAAERAEQLRLDAPGILGAALRERRTSISLSVGIAARRPGSAETINSLMRRADYAMSEARNAGPGLWRVSQEEVR